VALQRARMALGAALGSAIETSRPAIDAAGHRFTVTAPAHPVWLHADLTRVAQIISNLLNNAARYTPAGGRIELVAHVADGQVVVRVSDSGVGIPVAMLSKIFDLFTQGDGAAERSQGGLGVGLALSRQLAAMHGGQITVASPGIHGGSDFTLWLPLAG
jgi:signal transduction histidine kinase